MLGLSCAIPKPPLEAGHPIEEKPGGKIAPSNRITTLGIGYLMLESWDADPEVDGVRVELFLKDAQDNFVKTEGVVGAKLWLQPSILEKVKGDLIQKWSGIQITYEDYGWAGGMKTPVQIFIGGAKMLLQYKDYIPGESDYGILEVTFTTPDGRDFTAREKSIKLTGWD